MAAFPCTDTADLPPPSRVMADGSCPGMPPTESGAATVGISSPGRGGVPMVGMSSLGRAVGRGAGRWARIDPVGWTCSSTQLSMSLNALTQPVALVLHVPTDGLDVPGELGPDRLEPRDLFAQVPLGVLGDRLGSLLGLVEHPAGAVFRVRHEHASLGLCFGLGLVDELLGQQQRPLQGVVADRHGPLRLELALLQHALELGDALSRLPESLSRLAHLFLQRFGVYRYALEVLVYVVDVIAAKSLAKFDGTQAVEARALAARLSTVHVTNPSHGPRGHARAGARAPERPERRRPERAPESPSRRYRSL